MTSTSRSVGSARLLLLLLGASPIASGAGGAIAQQGPFTPWTGERGVTETVEQIMERQRALPHDEPVRRRPKGEKIRWTRPPRPNPDSPAVSQWPPVPSLPAGQDQAAGTNQSFTVGTSFLGVQASEYVWAPYPPDTGGAVGPTQVLFSVNGRIKVFGKDGTPGPLNVTADVFFQSVRNGFSAVDPQTKYDRLSGRFILTALTFGTPNRLVIAVSSGPTITGTGSFTFFYFQQDQVAPVGNVGEFADYDKVGVDANALYVGANIFNSSLVYTGSNVFVVRKSSILGGGPLVATAFRGIAAARTGLGPVYPMGVDNDDPASTAGYVAGVDGATFGTLVIRRISDPGGNPSISGNLFVTTPTTVESIPQPALGSASPLDSQDFQMLFDVQIHRDRSTGARTLWTAHTIEVNSSGVATRGGGRNGARWYEIGDLSTTPTLLQAGTLFDSAGANARGFTFPSCAMSGQGHMVLGATFAGNADRAGCAVAGRLASDALGTIAPPALPVVSTTSFNMASGIQRWGDMSTVDVDPVDDQTMWAFVEYCNADNSWGIRVIQVLAPPPAMPTGASPASLPQGATSQQVVITGTSSAGSAFYDTEPGFDRLEVAIGGGAGVTVTNVVFDGPTQITLTVDVSAGAPIGPRTVSVTNPDGQVATSASWILSVQGTGPGIPFCFGDGSLATPCPCGNLGSEGRGCPHSASADGALLESSGTVSPDTVVLAASDERPTALTIFLQGNTNASSGIPFGDGLRCANGTIKRLYVKTAVGGSASAPQGADPSITVRSAALGDPIAPGSSRFYHTYFRDPVPGFCPPHTFNSTNGVRIDW